MQEKGGIILALFFIVLLIIIGIVFINQVYLNEHGTNYKDASVDVIPTETTEVLIQ